MPGFVGTPQSMHRTLWLAALGALCVAAAPVRADPCAGQLGANARGNAERFSMITAQCPGLATSFNVQRAAQLDLYDRPAAPASAASAATPAAAASAPVPPLSPALTLTPPTRDEARVISLAPALTGAAREYQIDPLLLHAVAHVESRHNTRAVSRAGARGVMQVMPATGKRFGVTNPEQNLLDADTNLRASAAYLKTLRERFGDDLRLVLAAYNAGEGAVDKHGGVPPYPETQAYVRDVLAVYRRLSASFNVSASGRLVAKGR
jgi:soluble lytic murein transglycosylase-like protein